MKRARSSVIQDTDSSFNKELIAAIRSNPCLYDFKTGFSDKAIQDRVWEQLSVQFQEPVQALRDRWKNLRAGLTRYIRSQLLYERAEISRSHARRHVEPYYLFQEMQFFIPYTRVTKPTSMISEFTESDAGDPFLDDSDTTQSQYDSERQDMDNFETVFIQNELQQRDDGNIKAEDDANQRDRHEKKRQKILKVKSIAAESTSKADDAIFSPVVRNDYETTPEWHFFHSLMPDIMTMTAAQKRKLRIKFLCAVDDVLEKEQSET